jgi:hypothetical protein
MAKKKSTVQSSTSTPAAAQAAEVVAPLVTATTTAFDRGDYNAVRRLAQQGNSDAVSRLVQVKIDPVQLAVALGAIVVTLLVGATILRY